MSMDLLRFATAGSVDDGKSTLIGRLLFDSKAVMEDQLASVERTSKERGHDYTDLALVTDGRMSGASGQVPAAIHVSPEALGGGPLGRVRTGDMIRLDAVQGRLDAIVEPAEWRARELPRLSEQQSVENGHGLGRELFAGMRRNVGSAEEGACTWL